MKRGKAFIFSIHRITGIIIGLFFFMWFITGLVLIYHPFPNISDSQEYEKMDALPDSLPELDGVLARLPDSVKNIRSIRLRYFQEQALFSIKTKDSLYTICGDSLQQVKGITPGTIETVRKKWTNAPVSRVDTLSERDCWIMYTRYLDELPIYKFHLDDDEGHQLYISSRSGEVQQFTTRAERVWAWVGAIPHKFYIPAIRKNTDTWILSLTIGGMIALIAALSGLFLGIDALRWKYRRKQKVGSPYRKRVYKWHHLAGLIFGLFLVTWAISGAMALQRIPQWVVKTHGDYRVTETQLRGKQLPLTDYILDYRRIKTDYPDVKTIEWTHFQDTPIYNIVAGNKEISIDASSSEVKELNLTPAQIEKAIKRVHETDETPSISLIHNYEEYYLPWKSELPLPVYKIEVENADHSRYYLDPKTATFKYLNRNRMAKKWVFSGLHYLHIQWLMERPVLWTITIWMLCLGGAFVSLSGVWLGVKYFKRKIRKHRRIKQSQ